MHHILISPLRMFPQDWLKHRAALSLSLLPPYVMSSLFVTSQPFFGIYFTLNFPFLPVHSLSLFLSTLTYNIGYPHANHHHHHRVSPSYDDLYAVHDVFRVICGISVGYFLYDFIIAVIDVDFAFLAHGSLSYLIFAHSLRPYCSRLGGFFLFYEVSTIFLNIRALMIATRKTDHAIFPWVEKLFFGLFLLCRIGIGLFYSSFYTIPYLLGMLFDIPKAPHSYIATALFILANAVLNLLNIMWTIQIINTVRRSAKRQAEIKAQAAAAQAEQKKQD